MNIWRFKWNLDLYKVTETRMGSVLPVTDIVAFLVKHSGYKGKI